MAKRICEICGRSEEAATSSNEVDDDYDRLTVCKSCWQDREPAEEPPELPM